MAPLRSEFDNRHGAFREFLGSTVPAEIQARVSAASAEAANDIRQYLRRFDNYHWATLRAAVRRGGRYDGSRNVNLPHELTLRFESPVAVVWSKHVLQLLRNRTSALGADYVELVGEVVTWARNQGARVQPKRVEEFHNALLAEVRALQGVGREAIDELRERVKTQLYADLEERIRKKCAKFVEEKRDIGTGVKQRILDLIRDELTEVVVSAATPVATRVLTDNYNDVRTEINQALQRFRKPHLLDRTADEIVSAHEAFVRRSDAQKKRRVLADAEAVLAAAPAGTSSDAPPEAS